MTKKVAFFTLASALVAAAAGCGGGGSSAGATNPTVAVGAKGVASSTPAASGPAAPGSAAGSTSTAKATQPSGSTSQASGTAHATNPTEHITLSPTTTTSVVAWYHGTGGAAFTSLTKALGQASKASASGGVTAFSKTCGQIGSTAKAAQAAPPMPVANAAGWYTSALKGYMQSAADCAEGVSTQNQQLVQRAEGEVEANSTDLNQAAAVLIVALSAGK
jgi:hypothetical protein